MTTILLYALLTATLYYLGARAEISQPIWSRYPKRFGRFMDCAYCAGTWWGFLIGYVGGYHLNLDFAGLAGNDWRTVIVVGLCSTTWTPIVAAIALNHYYSLGSAVDVPEETHGQENDAPAA